MTWTKTKKAVVWGSVVVALAGVGIILFLERQDISDWMTIRAGERAVAKHIATPVDMTGHYLQSASLLENSSSYLGESAVGISCLPQSRIVYTKRGVYL